ncbi:hypothetical protein Tco_0201004 [Tanacetum coccineum]
MDTHEHLFFECDYAAKVWRLVRGYAEMDMVQPVLNDILLWFQPMGSRRTFQVIVGKQLFAATSYHIKDGLLQIQEYGEGSKNARVMEVAY